MFSFMLFIFLGLVATLAMGFYILRSQQRLVRVLRDDHAQMRVILRAMESRIDAMEGVTGVQPTLSGSVTSADDPLLHLSFDEPGQNLVSPADSGGAAKIDPELELHFDPASPPEGEPAAGR